MMHLQDLVGADKMKSWYERFGFGKSTKGMFDGEAPGQIGWSNELPTKTSSFGQSTTVQHLFKCYRRNQRSLMMVIC